MMKKKTMEGDRPGSHRSGGRCGSAFFIWFTARSSASSAAAAAAAATMRVPSCKSLRSPGRGRDPAAPSLSASLSKRLRNSRSLKGGQSPMFPAVATAASSGGGGRRKGCVLEAAEPSSPKVTCIGQVRVRSKKKKAKAKAAAMAMARSRSKRVSGSFRRTEEECLPRKNQRWVYQLPVSICEALRAFGSEFNCFLPCRNSPCSSSRTEEGKRGECEEKRTTSSCGQVLARWLMAMPEGEEGKRGDVVRLMGEERGKREMDLVIGDREKREMEGVEVGVANGNETEKKDEVLVVGDEGAASVCIPPRNALLLMRCRSDPVRMAALANQFWGSPATKVEVEEEEEEEEEGEEGDVEVGQHLFGLVEADREKVRAGRDEEAVAAAKARPGTGKPGKEAAEEEKSSQGAIFHAALEERESSAEKKQQRSSEEKQDENENREESLKERPSAHCAEVKRNPPREEVENAQLLEKSEEMAVKEETDLLDREEGKEGEEEKGRRSSNCSSSMGKEERRSHNHKCLSKAKEGGRRLSSSSTNKEKRRHSFSTERDARKHGFSNEREDRRASFSIEGKKRWSFSIDKEDLIPEEENALHEEEEKKKEEDGSVEAEEAREIEAVEKPKEAEEEIEVNGGGGSKEEENGRGEKEVKGDEEEKRGELPDCLLLMMYEPKVSMEVSKETWVCSTDFLRRLPHHRRQLPQGSGGGGGGGGGGERAKTERVGGGENKEVKTPAEPAALQVAPPPPPRAPPTASAIEQKLMSAAAEQAGPAASAYGPFVLTRCKSEPMRTSARLAPDACFWKDGRRPIGAAGIGF